MSYLYVGTPVASIPRPRRKTTLGALVSMGRRFGPMPMSVNGLGDTCTVDPVTNARVCTDNSAAGAAAAIAAPSRFRGGPVRRPITAAPINNVRRAYPVGPARIVSPIQPYSPMPPVYQPPTNPSQTWWNNLQNPNTSALTSGSVSSCVAAIVQLRQQYGSGIVPIGAETACSSNPTAYQAYQGSTSTTNAATVSACVSAIQQLRLQYGTGAVPLGAENECNTNPSAYLDYQQSALTASAGSVDTSDMTSAGTAAVATSGIPTWAYLAGGALLVLILMMRK